MQLELLAYLRPASEAPEELKIIVRKAADDDISFARLRASIDAVGILSPLIVKRHGNSIFVVAGNRRLRALQEIHNGNDKNVMVPTINVTEIDGEGEPREIALMHN